MATLADLINQVINDRAPTRQSLGPVRAQPQPFESPLAMAIRTALRPSSADMRQPLPAAPQAPPMASRPEYQFLQQTLAPAIGTAMDITGRRAPQPGYTQAQQIASDVLAPTGLPQLARSIGHVRNAAALPTLEQGPELSGAMSEGVQGLMNMAPWLMGGMMARAPEAAAEPVTRLPVNATRDIGRASDGSVMPIAPSQPFRTSLQGGSGDLMDAARSGPSLSVSQSEREAYLEYLRSQGFDVDQPLYHGTNADFEQFRLSSPDDMVAFNHVPLTTQPSTAASYAGRHSWPNPTPAEARNPWSLGANIRPVYARNAQRAGPTFLYVRSPEDVAPMFGRAPSSTLDAGNAYVRRLREQGFDVEHPLFHGSMHEIQGGVLLPSDGGTLGGGIYLTPTEARAGRYAERYSDGSRDGSRGGVHRVVVRGEIADLGNRPAGQSVMEAMQAAQERGASGARLGDTVVVWRRDNVHILPASPNMGESASRTPDGSPTLGLGLGLLGLAPTRRSSAPDARASRRKAAFSFLGTQ